MKRNLLKSLLALALVLVCGNVWGETYTLGSIPTSGWKTAGAQVTLNEKTWTYSSSTYIGITSNRIQVGSKNNPQTTAWTFSIPVSAFDKVTGVSISAYTTAESATYDIAVAGSSVKSGNLATTVDTYEATGLDATSGDIVITLTGSSTSKAMYLSGVTITYSPKAKTQAYLRWEKTGDQTIYAGGTFTNVAKLYDAAEGGNVITGQAITYSSSDETVATVDANGVVTAIKAGGAKITAQINSDSYKADAISYQGDVSFKYNAPKYETELVEGEKSGNKFTGKVQVAFTPADGAEGTDIRYTTDGTTPDASSMLYTEPFVLEETTTIKAISIDKDGCYSSIKSGTWTKVAVYSVTLGDDGTVISTTISSNKVTLPVRISSDNEFNVFAGWATAKVTTATESAPELFNGEYVATADVTLYPVFKKVTESESSSGWTLVEDWSTVTEGTYAIVTGDGKKAFNGTINGSGHGEATEDAFAFVNGSATSAPEGTLELTFKAVDGGFTIYAEGLGYLYIKAAKAGNLAFHETEGSYWTFSDNMYYAGTEGARLRCFDNTFRTYGANNNTAITLAKKGAVTKTLFQSVEPLKYTREVTEGNFGTICLPFAAAATSGATFYEIAGKVEVEGAVKSIKLNEVSELEAGVPYIFQATAGTISVTYIGAAATASSANGLVGSLDGCDVAEGMYLISSNQVKKCGTGCSIAANRAYINMADVPAYDESDATASVEIRADGTTSIADVLFMGNEEYFDLQGRKVENPTSGLYIVNGKKVMVK